MKNAFKRYTWLKLVEGILLALIGILVAILGGIDPEQYQKGLSISVAVFLFLDGLIMFITGISDKKAKFSVNIITGSLLIAIGVVLIASDIKLNEFLPYFVGSVLLAIGAGEIGKAIIQFSQKEKVVWPIVNLLIAVIAIVLGVLSIVYRKGNALNIIYIILGIAIVVIATAEIVLAILSHKEKRRAKAEGVIDQEEVIVVDAEVVEKKEDVKQIANKKNKKKQIETKDK